MFTSREALRLQSRERESLQAVIRSARSPAGWICRVQVPPLLAEGLSVRRVEAQTGMSPLRVVYWKQRWQLEGWEGLLDARRPGRPKKLTAEKEALILTATQSSPGGRSPTGRVDAWPGALASAMLLILQPVNVLATQVRAETSAGCPGGPLQEIHAPRKSRPGLLVWKNPARPEAVQGSVLLT